MSGNGDYMCTKRLNRAIKSKEMASDWKISAHTFGMDFRRGKWCALEYLETELSFKLYSLRPNNHTFNGI